jgi:hypothetical protein
LVIGDWDFIGDLVDIAGMRALSIRQPYAELILRGIKTIEYRSRPTYVIGERFYIYVPLKAGELEGFRALGCEPGDLPTGVFIGTAAISHCTRDSGHYQWDLMGVQRLGRVRKPVKPPQPARFKPF